MEKDKDTYAERFLDDIGLELNKGQKAKIIECMADYALSAMHDSDMRKELWVLCSNDL